MRILFVCTLFTFTILAMETKDNSDLIKQLDRKSFCGIKNDVYRLIFRYLTLSEQGIYSKLNQKLYYQFRTPFFFLRTYELLCGLSWEFQTSLQASKWVNNLTDETLQRRALLLKEDISGFNNYVEILVKSESDYTQEEQIIMGYVTEMKDDRTLTNSITLNGRNPNDILYIYNLQDHTVYSKHKDVKELLSSFEKVTMPLVIQYRINDQDHMDVFAEYEEFLMTNDIDDAEIIDLFFSTSNRDVYPKVSFFFVFNKNSNTITEVLMDYFPQNYECFLNSYTVDHNVLSGKPRNMEIMEIKSIITSNSLIQTETTNMNK